MLTFWENNADPGGVEENIDGIAGSKDNINLVFNINFSIDNKFLEHILQIDSGRTVIKNQSNFLNFQLHPNKMYSKKLI